MHENGEVTFKGTVEKCIYQNGDFKIYAFNVNTDKYNNVKTNKYNNVSVIGNLPSLSEEVEYEVIATEESSKYGVSYRVVNIKRDIPTTAEGTILFLKEILTDNQANEIYKHYPDIVNRVKENRLDDIDLSKLYGIGEYTFEKIKNKIVENFMLIDMVSEFDGLLSLSMIRKMYAKYQSIDVLREKLKKEPYTTLTGISGVGFKTADGIVMDIDKNKIIDFGYDIKTSMDRCLACLVYLLKENENDGNTKMNLAELRSQCLKIVPECIDKFADAIKTDLIYYNKERMEIALNSTYMTEKYIADSIRNNIVNNESIWDFDIDKYKNVGEFELSNEQLNALNNVCKYNISILNGAAGTGKTNSTFGIINMLDDNNKIYMLLAPTGKASKVLSEYTGHHASTIHRGLGCDGVEWLYNKDNKLFCDIIIIDEFSMVDVNLFRRIIDAIDFKYTKLLMIGDNAQLPSVSCGNLLHDFMSSKIIPVTTLTKVFRYGEGGMMKVATDTRMSKMYLDRSMKGNATKFGNNEDYTFIDVDQDGMLIGIAKLYKKLLDNGNNVSNIQVLTAKNIGDYGTIALNNILQRVANCNYGSNTYMKVGDTNYYIGDLVMQTANNYNAQIVDSDETAFVANGENGIIEEVYNNYIVINFDGIKVKYTRDNMYNVSLGYAITIHKSQGSGIDNVILCTPKSHIFMLNSNLIYVGLTRMKKRCYHFGDISTVNGAVKKKANLNRHTFMQQLLAK